MSKNDDVLWQLQDGVVRITINRPEKLNAATTKTALDLQQALQKAEATSSARVIVLEGAGRAFGAGYDLTNVDPTSQLESEVVLKQYFNPLVLAMRRSQLPIVSAVRGACIGGSLGLALAADVVIAGRSAYFCAPFTGIGLVPDAGSSLFLTRMLGRSRASPMMLLGERVNAEKALQWGLVWDVVDDAQLDAAVLDVCVKLQAQDRDAVAATKQLIAQVADSTIEAQLEMEAKFQGEAGRRPALLQRITRFVKS